ncbi:unnamed protein product [Rotaria magnacalcarata]|uniref:Uncharacterized protein n=1 Tax=Rotaria magnacalcarata TaxID=392030 RepID=A0A816X010_9BILA|nr:unnamed protein product [Rotaria magnacalcarata]CAF4013961.1 unnamed protein product [Rotaria magnacalcarata]
MALNGDLVQYGQTVHHGTIFNFSVVDFSMVHSNAPLIVKSKCRDFRDKLILKFSSDASHRDNARNPYYTWTIELIWSTIINDVIVYNDSVKCVAVEHAFVFVCFDNSILPHEREHLLSRYGNSVFFESHNNDSNSNFDTIFDYLLENGRNKVVRRKSRKRDYSYPLRLHANSNSSGLFFNYFYTYLNRQVGFTNNIILTFIFNRNITQEAFPSSIRVLFDGWIESCYLDRSPSTMEEGSLLSLQSNTLVFTYESLKHDNSNGNQTLVTFNVTGVGDFGQTIEKLNIWQEKFDLDSLILIQLKDDIREWNENYRRCSCDFSMNEQALATFHAESSLPESYPRLCHFFSIEDVPSTVDRHTGVHTIKKTTKDCFDKYIEYVNNMNTQEENKNIEIRLVPVYYLIALTSCNFGPPDTSNSIVYTETIPLQGTIIDPHDPTSIHLATVAGGEILRSKPMTHYNRYLQRTFYYIDEIVDHNKIIRYLFCGEYPYILSILGQLERNGLISRAQKRDEYLRFCSMLNRMLAIENLSESIKLIQIDDEERPEMNQNTRDNCGDQANYADMKSLPSLIKDDIEQWYEKADLYTAELSITSMLLESQPNNRLVHLFFKKTNTNQLNVALIKDLKEKLEGHGYTIDDIDGDVDSIEDLKQIIFICTEEMTDNDNRQIIKAVERKINKIGVLRDIFIFINDAIQRFSCHLIKSIPYLIFDLRLRIAKLTDDEVREVIEYLTNMNVQSKTYTDMFDDIYDSTQQTALQCTSVGAGCAAACYFNYAKLLTSLPIHQERMELIRQQLFTENFLDFKQSKSIFINKWVFVIPWTIENSSQLLSCGRLLSDDEQNRVGFKLSFWKPKDCNFVSPKLAVTVGGVFLRSYSALIIYELTNLINKQTIYFPMEIPAAFSALQTQYQSILSHFNFGTFDPLEQATTFRKKIEEYKANEQGATWHDNIVLVPLDQPSTTPENMSITSYEKAEILLNTLWKHLSSSH